MADQREDAGLFFCDRYALFRDMKGNPGHFLQHAQGIFLSGYIVAQRIKAQGGVAVLGSDFLHRLRYMRVGPDNQVRAGQSHFPGKFLLIGGRRFLVFRAPVGKYNHNIRKLFGSFDFFQYLRI